MKISHFGGVVECNHIKDLDKILDITYGKGVNEFWLYGKDKYPCVSILVNGGHACAHYFPSDQHPGFQSVSQNLDSKTSETNIFYVNTVNEKVEIINKAVIKLSTAKKVAKDFFSTLKMSNKIEWFEL